MTKSEREAVFRALVGRVDRVRDPAVVKQLEKIAAGQLEEMTLALDRLLDARYWAGRLQGLVAAEQAVDRERLRLKMNLQSSAATRDLNVHLPEPGDPPALGAGDSSQTSAKPSGIPFGQRHIAER